jgi:hypothetical protein
MVGVTFVIALLALSLHVRPLFVAMPSREVLSPREENLGARLQRECESVANALGVEDVTRGDVLMILEEDRTVVEEFERKNIRFPERIDYLMKKQPAKWDEGVKEAFARRRASMIRSCIIQRSSKVR